VPPVEPMPVDDSSLNHPEERFLPPQRAERRATAAGGEAGLIIWGALLAIVCCYVPACYIAAMRTGRTIFDLAAGRRLSPANSGQ
jgi:hypothetical protein